jgi:hypothetical protein
VTDSIFKVDDKQWELEVRDNHARSLNPSAHNVYGKRTQAQKDTIQAMTHAGVRPMQIMAAIQKEDTDNLSQQPTSAVRERRSEGSI